MPTLAAADRLSYVNALKLPAPGSLRLPRLGAADSAGPPPPPPTPGDPAAAVDGASVVSFLGSVSPQSQSDALNSTLLAYLGATAQFDPIKDTVDWYKSYAQTMTSVGWDPQAFGFTQYDASGATLTIDQVVLEIVGALLGGGPELALLQTSLTALQNLPSTSGILQIWNTQSHTENSGNFQISTANETNGVMTLAIGAFYFTTTETVHEVFWTTYASSSMSLFKATQQMTLDGDVYAGVRDQIVAKLQPYAQSYVANLPLPPPPHHS